MHYSATAKILLKEVKEFSGSERRKLAEELEKISKKKLVKKFQLL